MKQTALEWLLNEISLTTILDKEDVKLFEQAKEIEKQQLEKTYNNAWMLGQDHIETDFKDYYNKTFKQL